eukprot:TRINITY_DN14868_c0_g1_i1.p1 TRINITY_DN14868_c0_g1~~TRINITY_DN14868_c0_g1_i1.p1  ORF type:complete len:187 (+),score=46.33 TRINITY_DN14868_c0_g1_i1:94-654(+)
MQPLFWLLLTVVGTAARSAFAAQPEWIVYSSYGTSENCDEIDARTYFPYGQCVSFGSSFGPNYGIYTANETGVLINYFQDENCEAENGNDFWKFDYECEYSYNYSVSYELEPADDGIFYYFYKTSGCKENELSYISVAYEVPDCSPISCTDYQGVGLNSYGITCGSPASSLTISVALIAAVVAVTS